MFLLCVALLVAHPTGDDAMDRSEVVEDQAPGIRLHDTADDGEPSALPGQNECRRRGAEI